MIKCVQWAIKSLCVVYRDGAVLYLNYISATLFTCLIVHFHVVREGNSNIRRPGFEQDKRAFDIFSKIIVAAYC